ncbi:MAG: metallophosphoesterase [Sedimentisphaerales bacterium]|nr:metallophosphoesterase [Sedimentisphaerales bacterium]
MRRLLSIIPVILVAGTLGAQTKPAALVYEYADQWTQSLGAAEYLEQAGFSVSALPLDQSPRDCRADMIFFGSFASQSPAYQAYMKTYAADLARYVEQGHLLVQMVQADQTEEVPPFLPADRKAKRADQDSDKAFVLRPECPLLSGLAKKSFSFHPRVTIWESFVDQEGFEVALAADADAQLPALMECACGQGRMILCALALDKKRFGSFGEPTDEIGGVREVFFRNLAAHAVAVRNRAAEPLVESPSPPKVIDFVDGSWTLVLLPDTQNYSQHYPGIFLAQTAWIVQNRDKRNIRFVLQLGDITNNNTIKHWENARLALSLMDQRVPYAFCPGNHDYGPNGNASTRETLMNEYLPYETYAAWPTFGAAREPGKMDNTYHCFEAGGQAWIVLALEWGPRDSTIAWARQVMADHPGRKGILITHAYLNNNDRRYDHQDSVNPQLYNPHLYSTPGGVNDGQELWDKLVNRCDFTFVFNGHVLGDGTGYRADRNARGKNVHQMLANYQMRELGGEGYLRLLEFLPDGRTVQVKTYSPLYDKYLLAPDQQFSIALDF